MTGFEKVVSVVRDDVGWPSEYHDRGLQKDLEDWTRSHHEAHDSSTDRNTDIALSDNLISMHQLSEKTHLLEDYDKTIAAGLETLASIKPLEQLDGLERRTSTWWCAAAMLSKTYHNRAREFPSLERYHEAEKYQLRLVGAVGTDLVQDMVLHGWHSSRLAAIYVGKHKMAQSADLEFLDEALARSDIAMKKLEQVTAPKSIETSINETHCLTLFSHFQASHIFHRLEEALKYSRIVVNSFHRHTNAENLATPEHWGMRLWNHGTILDTMYHYYTQTNPEKARQTLDQAIDSGKEALKLCCNNQRNRDRVLCSVASWYGDYMQSTENLKWGEDAIELLEKISSHGKPVQKDFHSIRSRIFYAQYSISRRQFDVELALQKRDLAIMEGEKAVVLFGKNDPSMGKAYKNLADMQKNKLLDSAHVDTKLYLQIKENFMTAAKAEKASLLIRIPAALERGLYHIRDGEIDGAHDIFQYAISLLPVKDQHSIPSQDLQAVLQKSSTLAEYAASAALATESPLYEALRSLEASRCIIMGRLMKLQANLHELSEIEPSLATKYNDYRIQLLRELRKAASPYDSHSPTAHSLSMYLTALEEDIRELEHFKDFQQPLTEADMKDLACEGPVVVINVSKMRSDAIIVTRNEIELSKLPSLSYDELKKRVDILRELSNESERDCRPRIKDKSASAVSKSSEALLWLWNACVRQILGSTPLTSTKRVWWITSGLASQIPFHAAGDHTPGSTNNAISRVTSSYISSFKALRFAREQAAAMAAMGPDTPLGEKKLLCITVSQNPTGLTNLDTRAEVQALQDVFSRSKIGEASDMYLERPSPATVLYHFQDFSFIHFACHGKSVGSDPLQSGLLLVGDDGEEKTLTIADLEKVPMFEFAKNPELIYLSACSTAGIRQDDGKLADEAMHLGNLFQALGFRDVIGTLWRVRDLAAGQVAKGFYEQLFQHEGGPTSRLATNPERLGVAHALHKSTLEYRNNSRSGGHPLDWIPFIHIGG